MKLEEFDFARNPIVENQTFFLESKCVHCGFEVVARSLEELLQEEKRHRAMYTEARRVIGGIRTCAKLQAENASIDVSRSSTQQNF
jgi:rubrerythrin